MDQMKDYKQLIKELPSKTVVFAFGRFNPPTIGHELLIKAVKKLAQQKNADHVIYASRSQDAKKNPLSVVKKVKYLNLMFRNTKFTAANEQARTFIEAATQLNKKYKNIVMVAGSDRVAEFKRLLNTYNGKEFNFDTIEVISAGERDPDADDASGMSASKMRTLASKGNYAEFKKGLPSTVRDIDGKRLMNDIRDGMGLGSVKEQVVLVKDNLREQYFLGEVYNEGDLVESDGVTYTIVKRGSNHLLLKESTGKLVSKWIHDVQPKEEKDMNEELTQKTLKSNDKIKVARVIATMLGVNNAETSSNPENLINLGLRKVRSKALNPEALSVIKRMLRLATSTGIKYDNSLLPAKLKEAVMQPNGTDKIEVQTSEPIAAKKGIMRLNDYVKGKVGSSLHDDEKPNDDQIRKMKVKYKLGEDKEQKEVAKATLAAKHAREKESLSVKHDTEKDGLKRVSEEHMEESQTDHWKKVQSMDKGSILAGKDGAKKRVSYLRAVHDYHKKYGNDTKKVKSEIERINRSRLAEELLDESSEKGLAGKAKKSGVSIGTLRKVYNRGMAAWKTGHRPGTTPQQWGMARVNSYISKGSGTYGGADKDLREEELAENNLPKVPKDKESGLPKKYVAGVSDSTAKARAAHFDKNKDKSDSDSSAYQPAPGDATAKTKESEHTKKYRAMYGEDMDEEIYEACWDSHKQVGMKKKGNKMVPDCVPKNEEVDQIDEISSKLAGDYYGAATKKHIDKVGIKPNMYGRIAKDMGKKRAAGVDRAMDRITGDRKTNEEALAELSTDLLARYKKKASDSATTADKVGDFKKGDKRFSGIVKATKKQFSNDLKENEIEFHNDICPECKEDPCVCDTTKANNSNIKNKPFDPFFKESAVDFSEYEENWEDYDLGEEPTEQELDHFMAHILDDEILDLYDEDELSIVDDETGEELPEDDEESELEEGVLSEVLSRVERMKAKFRIRRTKAKRARATKIALKRYSNTKTINKRSRRLAVKLMKKRLLRGRDTSKLSVGEKERVERIVQSRKKIIDRLAMRLAPRVRKVEKARMSHSKLTKGSSNVAF